MTIKEIRYRARFAFGVVLWWLIAMPIFVASGVVAGAVNGWRDGKDMLNEARRKRDAP